MDDPTDEEEAQESVSESEADEPLSPEQRIEELEQELELAKKDLLYRQAEVQNALSQVAKTRSEGVRYGATDIARRKVR